MTVVVESARTRTPQSAEAVEAEDDYTPAIYGSLLVTTLVAVQWRADANPGYIGLSLATSVGIFWLTHVWAELTNRRLRGRVDRHTVGHIALVEASMLTAVVVPGILLGLPFFFGTPVDIAIGAALLASLVQLFLWGLAVGRVTHRSWPSAFMVGAVDCALGVAVVALKVLILH
jgi:hypothetical protein